MQPASLLVSRDCRVEELLRRLLEEADMAMDVSPSTSAARHLLGTRKFDAILVDCDDMDGAREVLLDLRQDPLNRRAIIFAILNGATSASGAFHMGAHFVLQKPISAERGARTLRAAAGIILYERRRYSRVPVEMPVSLLEGRKEEEKERHAGTATGLSGDGIGVKTERALRPGTIVQVRFELPESCISVEAMGEVAWASQRGEAGIRFLDIQSPGKRRFRTWLAERVPEEERFLPQNAKART
jgi:DNA-binding response OmpR family regulator